MASSRTQIYLTAEQREKLDRVRARTGMSLAEAVRAALDLYLQDAVGDARDVLETTFGALPDITPPDRSEWDRA